MNAKITMPELVAQVAQATGTTKRMSELFLRELFAVIAESLAAGERVTVKDLGTFGVQSAGEAGGQVPTFVAAKRLAEVVNQPFEAFAPVELADDVDLAELDAAAVPASEQISVSEPEQANEVVPASEPEQPAEPVLASAPEQATVVEQAAEPVPPLPAEPIPPQAAESEQVTIPPQFAVPVPPQPASQSPQLASQAPQSDEMSLQLLEQVKLEASRKSLWKGVAIGLLAGVLGTLAMTHLPAAGRRPQPEVQAQQEAAAQGSEPAVQDPQPVVTDTVSPTMYLTRMAIKHYGAQEFWVYIYRENEAIIDNPNRIEPGTVLVIPPAAKYGIDAADSASVTKAKQQSKQLLDRFK